MAAITLSPVSGLSAVKSACQTCQTAFDSPAGLENNLMEGSRAPPVKIILKLKVCLACKAIFDRYLDRKTRAYWTKKKFQKWAETVIHVTVKLKKKYMVKFHRGTTLKLRHSGKVSTLRVPNRWTTRII
jgi:hypothetical protein